MSSGVKWNEDYQDFYSDNSKMGRVLAICSAFNGQQIVSAEWKQPLPPQTECLESQIDKLGYGYQIGLPPEAEVGEFFALA